MFTRILPALLLAPALAAAEPIKLNGLTPGMTQAQLEQAHKGLGAGCGPARLDGKVKVQTCGYSSGNRSLYSIPALDTFEAMRVDGWVVTLRDGTASTIAVTMDGKEFNRVVAALREKYGKPESEVPGTTQNRLGEKFDQLDVTWKVDGTVLLAKKRQSRVDRMGLYLTAK